MQTRQWLVRATQGTGAFHSTSPTTSHMEMYVELEIMPGKRRSYFMLGVRLGRTGERNILWRVWGIVWAHITTTSTPLPKVRQNSSLHLGNRNTRRVVGVGCNSTEDSNRTTGKVFPRASAHTHTMRLRLGGARALSFWEQWLSLVGNRVSD